MKRQDESLNTFEHCAGIESNIQYRSRLKEALATSESCLLLPVSDGDFDTELKNSELSLMEEICLIDLNTKASQMSIWNDYIPYVLRGCILIELALSNRILAKKDSLIDEKEMWKLHVQVQSCDSVKDPFLQEALEIISKDNLSVQYWMDALTGESWKKAHNEYQIYNLRDRLCKSLLEKGVVTTRKSSLFFVKTTEYPILNHNVVRNICNSIADIVTSRNRIDLRSLCRIVCMNSAQIINKTLCRENINTSEKAIKFAKNASETYKNHALMKSRFNGEISEGSLKIITAVFQLFHKMNKFF